MRSRSFRSRGQATPGRSQAVSRGSARPTPGGLPAPRLSSTAASCSSTRPRGRSRFPCVRICVVYDCLYPYTVGGAERWYRNLALRLAEDGHDVTYLTLRQWDRGLRPDLPGVRVVAVAPRMRLYVKGRRSEERRVGKEGRCGS